MLLQMLGELRNDKETLIALRTEGGIVADEIGLRNTNIICAFINYLISIWKPDNGKYQPILILVPPAVIYQWMDELRR